MFEKKSKLSTFFIPEFQIFENFTIQLLKLSFCFKKLIFRIDQKNETA
jgi:hypothetical protein